MKPTLNWEAERSHGVSMVKCSKGLTVEDLFEGYRLDDQDVGVAPAQQGEHDNAHEARFLLTQDLQLWTSRLWPASPTR